MGLLSSSYPLPVRGGSVAPWLERAACSGVTDRVSTDGRYLPWVCGRDKTGDGTCHTNIPFGYWYSLPADGQCREEGAEETCKRRRCVAPACPCVPAVESASFHFVTSYDYMAADGHAGTWRRLSTAQMLKGDVLLQVKSFFLTGWLACHHVHVSGKPKRIRLRCGAAAAAGSGILVRIVH